MASSQKPLAQREMKVLSLGLLRTGSLSMCEALRIIGYKDIHHAIHSIGTPRLNKEWEIIDRACDATFPTLPTYTGKPFTREDWDEVFGDFEGATDAASFFGHELIQAYPEAKVILVIRDFEKWNKSVNGVIDIVYHPLVALSRQFEKLTGSVVSKATFKSMQGLFEAQDEATMRKNTRRIYDRHNRRIQELVPPERLLVYKLGSGWEPLCEFLGKPVPDAEFPWVNESAALKSKMMEVYRKQLSDGVKVLIPWLIGAAGLGYASWAMVKKYRVLELLDH
ncbi:hypothetical protein PT974_05844 [Cladobotryum mycophilum]|uniref:Uncharacterized protein n=1 Tax=Cladobotryum mycophilum TaxID=491253 RepID=A0ABR0SJW5_9HYPO